MCGIAGHLARPGAAPLRELVVSMTRALAHRGPDGEGFHFDARAAIGHRRLSFLDIARGAQPIYSEDRSLCVVCNGEIYNFIELRKELQAKGHSFSTESDSEVVVHLYEEHGADAFSRLEGMFALALWDAKKGELILARDPFGIKPLHYSETADGILFASELKALLKSDGVDRSVDPLALRDYLTSLSVRDPHCILRGVKKVPPAMCLRFDGNGPPRETRFWTPPSIDPRIGANGLAERLRDALAESVSISLRSDVPVGIFLSGGIDSSAIAALARRGGATPTAFCLGFEENAFDESGYADAVARHLGLRLESVRLTKRDAAALTEQLCAGIDEPFGDASALPTLMLSSFARQSVKAVLSGEGADELFGGNFWHHPARDPSARADEEFPYGRRTAFDSDGLSRLCGPALADRRRSPEPATSLGDSASRRDLETYLPSDLLVKMDRVPMMAGLEARVPFLNRRVADFALRIPWPLRAGDGKALLKESIGGLVPPDVTRRTKKGFSIPLDAWLWEEGDFRALVRETVLSEKARSRGWFDAREVERLFHEQDRLARMNGYRIWLLFGFEMWCRNFIDRR